MAMASPWLDTVGALRERIDSGLLPALYNVASIETAAIREAMDSGSRPYRMQSTDDAPALEVLDASADWWIRRSTRRASVRGLVGGSLGAFSLPPEVLASLVASLRLAQRLAVTFGFDPETDRGRVVLWRAVAEAYGLELPDAGVVGMKITELPRALAKQPEGQVPATALLVRRVVEKATNRVVRRFTRWVPGFGAGLGAWGANRQMRQMGEKMHGVFRRAAGPALPSAELIEDAIEVV